MKPKIDLRKLRAAEATTKHGEAARGKATPAYVCWASMKYRCYNKNCGNYHDYGGRGIRVCERWLNSFENFKADMGPKPKWMFIERRDNNGNYEPSNCYYATRKEQNNNKRSNRLATLNGKTQNFTQWAQETGIQMKTICKRIDCLGWSDTRALTTPVKQYVRRRP